MALSIINKLAVAERYAVIQFRVHVQLNAFGITIGRMCWPLEYEFRKSKNPCTLHVQNFTCTSRQTRPGLPLAALVSRSITIDMLEPIHRFWSI